MHRASDQTDDAALNLIFSPRVQSSIKDVAKLIAPTGIRFSTVFFTLNGTISLCMIKVKKDKFSKVDSELCDPLQIPGGYSVELRKTNNKYNKEILSANIRIVL